MTDLTTYEPRAEVTTLDPTGGRLVAWAEAAVAAHQLAKSLAQTTFVPKHFQGKPGDATAAIILGDELGLSPLSALRSIHVISGTPGLYARTMAALVQSHGHQMWTEEETEQKVTVAGQRRGSEHVERVTWTIDRARKAGYTTNKKYQTDPIAMLYARASGDVARRIAPDVLAGVPYSIEEIELSETPTTTVTRQTAAKRTVQRAKPEAPEPEIPEPDQAQAPTEPTTTPMTSPQNKKMHALFNDLGITDHDAQISGIVRVIGRQIESKTELTVEEAAFVIDSLEIRLRQNTETAEPPLDDEPQPLV
jgi:hypothetical protein